jgi:hypothetical protein
MVAATPEKLCLIESGACALGELKVAYPGGRHPKGCINGSAVDASTARQECLADWRDDGFAV